MVVSWNGDASKLSILMVFSSIDQPFGVSPFMETPILDIIWYNWNARFGTVWIRCCRWLSRVYLVVHPRPPQSKGLLAKRAGTRNPKLRQLSHLPWAIGRSKANIVQICNTFWTRQKPPDLWNAEDQAFPAFLCSAPCWLADRCARGHSWITWPSKLQKL